MKILTIANQKGGVGKTSTAHALGTGLHNRGYKVLFVDLDAQGNLSFTVGSKSSEQSPLFLPQLTGGISSKLQRTASGDILASTPTLAGADNRITATGKEYRLKELLETVATQYDYCIIDTPPSLGILTINALTASQGVIIPTQADVYSLQGIHQLTDTIDAVRKYCNPTLTILGIVITRYNARSIIRREITDILEDTAKHIHTTVYTTKIRECIALLEAQATKQDIYTYSPRSNATADYNSLLDEILNQLKD